MLDCESSGGLRALRVGCPQVARQSLDKPCHPPKHPGIVSA